MSDLPQQIGRYEIIEEIGCGGMGLVYKARDPNIGRLVALKVIKLSFEADDEMTEEMHERFAREARAAGILHHPNIVTIFDAGEDDGVPYIAMEYVEGVTLEHLLAPEEIMPPDQVNLIIRQVAEGLAYAHDNGIVHRDIKPANILVTEEGTAKIMDFGIARLAGSDLTRRGVVMGSPSYMSPEQVTGRVVDHKSDIFSLGVILYQCITGERPFPGENPTVISYRIVREEPPDPSELNPSNPSAYDRVVKISMAKRSEDRYDSAKEMARDLTLISEGGELQKTSKINMRASGVRKTAISFWQRPGVKWTAAALVMAAMFFGLVLISLRVSNPYVEVHELIEAGQHDRAVLTLLRIRSHKPKDHRAVYLLGREYAELKDFRSSIKAYAQALLLHTDYHSDDQLLSDIVLSLSRSDADLAIQLIVSKVGEPIVEKLRAALEDNSSHDLRWNAAEALRGLGEEVDEFPILELDLIYSPDCKVRRTAVERMGELGKVEALPELERAKGDRRNTRACMKNSIEEAQKRIHEENPQTE